MANNVVGSLIVNLGLETGRLNSDTKKAERNFNRFDKKASRSLNNIKNRVRGLMTAMGGLTGVAGVLSVAGLGAVISSSLDAADAIGKMSDRIGASTEALSEYKHVAELSGIEFKTLTMGWQRMTRRVSEAAGGFGEAKGALKELNLSAVDLNKLKPEDQFEAITVALSGLTNQADKVRLAMKLFDSEGVSLIQTMKGGKEGIQEMREEARALGLSLSRDQTDAAAKANNSITILKNTWAGFATQLTTDMAPALSKVIRQLSVGIPGAAKFAEPAFEGIGDDIFRLWKFLNPSDISTGTSLETALKRQAELVDNLATATRSGGDDAIAVLSKQLEKQDLLVNSLRMQAKIQEEFRAGGKPPLEPAGPIVIPLVGGAGIDKEEQERIDRSLKLKIDALTLSQMDEENRLFESLARQEFMVEDAFERGLVNTQRHQELLLGLESDFESKMTAISIKGMSDRQKFEVMSAKDKTKTVLGEMINMTQGVAQHSKTMFKINKTASLANALVSGYESFNKTMAAYPYPYNIGLAALGAAATGAQISAIQSTSFGGGGSGTTPSAAGSVPTINDTPVTSLPDQQQAPQGSQITINISGVIGDEDVVRQVVVEAIETAQANDEIRIVSNG